MDGYQRLLDIVSLSNLQMQLEHWVLSEVLIRETLVQIAGLLAAILIALIASGPARGRVLRRLSRPGPARPFARRGAEAADALVLPAIVLLLTVPAVLVGQSLGLSTGVLATAAKLLAAWTAIRLLAVTIGSDFWARTATVIAFAIAALAVFGLLEVTIVRLDRMIIHVGTVSLSVLDLLRAAVELALLIWVALLLARLLESRVQGAENIPPSLRVLTGKLLHFALLTIAVIVALSSVGIDFTAFAVFTGALGVAIGFGMQKSISNLISGLLLLMDRSIKPGDVLELTDPSHRDVQLFGWVTALNARYVSLTTRDGTEWLVPNDELISRRIVNWSFSHNRLRLLTPIAVSFDCDVRLAIRLAVEAAHETARVLKDPEPVCRLMGFGDSCVKLEMRFWIEDPRNGIINVRSEVLLGVWEKFQAAGIRTAFAYRDLQIKPGSELSLRVDRHRVAQGD